MPSRRFESLPERGSTDLFPTPISGFDHVKRFVDPVQGRVVAKILPGEFYVTNSPDEVIATVLGSCVAACIWDGDARIGGMNHFMLAGAGGPGLRADTDAARYGMYAMEILINTILAWGGRRSRLKAKLAGGGNVIAGSSTIGQDNIEFARSYLIEEGVDLVAEHVGGVSARRLLFHPLSGRTKIMTLSAEDDRRVGRNERDYAASVDSRPPTGTVELFVD